MRGFMPGSASNGSNAPADAFASGHEPIVREQTVKAWNPLMSPPPATEGTVKTPMPQPPREQTVRARVPMPDLPWGGPLVEVTEGVPVSRSNAPTLPEAGADADRLARLRARVREDVDL